MRQWCTSLSVVGGVLILGVWVLGSLVQGEVSGTFRGEVFPVQTADWLAEDLPLGSTESVAEAAEKILRLDAFVNRSFRRGESVVTLYVAYWKPGSLPVQRVASHTPDRCWTAAGWTCTERRTDVALELAGTRLRPAQYRVFETAAGKQYVYFWHLYGGRLYDYGERFQSWPHPVDWLKGAVRSLGGRQGEQYFVRINSTEPLERFEETELMRAMVEGLVALGLGEDGEPSLP